jgi:hypothetical protein
MRRRLPRERRSPADELALECARIASAFDLLLKAAIGRLMLHYASRLASVALCARHRHAAMEALRMERDAAVEALRSSILRQKEAAMLVARTARRNRRRERNASPVQYRLRAGPLRASFRRRSPRRDGPRPG